MRGKVEKFEEGNEGRELSFILTITNSILFLFFSFPTIDNNNRKNIDIIGFISINRWMDQVTLKRMLKTKWILNVQEIFKLALREEIKSLNYKSITECESKFSLPGQTLLLNLQKVHNFGTIFLLQSYYILFR